MADFTDFITKMVGDVKKAAPQPQRKPASPTSFITKQAQEVKSLPLDELRAKADAIAFKKKTGIPVPVEKFQEKNRVDEAKLVVLRQKGIANALLTSYYNRGFTKSQAQKSIQAVADKDKTIATFASKGLNMFYEDSDIAQVQSMDDIMKIMGTKDYAEKNWQGRAKTNLKLFTQLGQVKVDEFSAGVEETAAYVESEGHPILARGVRTFGGVATTPVRQYLSGIGSLGTPGMASAASGAVDMGFASIGFNPGMMLFNAVLEQPEAKPIGDFMENVAVEGTKVINELIPASEDWGRLPEQAMGVLAWEVGMRTVRRLGRMPYKVKRNGEWVDREFVREFKSEFNDGVKKMKQDPKHMGESLKELVDVTTKATKQTFGKKEIKSDINDIIKETRTKGRETDIDVINKVKKGKIEEYLKPEKKTVNKNDLQNAFGIERSLVRDAVKKARTREATGEQAGKEKAIETAKVGVDAIKQFTGKEPGAKSVMDIIKGKAPETIGNKITERIAVESGKIERAETAKIKQQIKDVVAKSKSLLAVERQAIKEMLQGGGELGELSLGELRALKDSLKAAVERSRKINGARQRIAKLRAENTIAALERTIPKKKTMDSLRKFKSLKGFFDTMDSVFMLLDYQGGKFDILKPGMWTDYFKGNVDRSHSNYLKDKFSFETDMFDVIRNLELNAESRRKVGINLVTKNKDGRTVLRSSGVTAKELAAAQKLSPKEQQFADYVRRSLEAEYAEVDLVMRENEGRSLGYIEEYFPFLTNFDAMTGTETMGNPLRHQQYKTKFRAGETRAGAEQSILLDAAQVLYKYKDSAAYYKNMRPTLETLGSVTHNSKFSGIVGRETSGKINDWLDLLSRRGITKSKNPVIDPILRIVRRNAALAYMGYKFTTVIKQPLAVINSLPFIGARGIGEMMNVKEMLSPKEWRKVFEKSSELQNRMGGDQTAMELLMEGKFAEFDNITSFKGGYKKFVEASMKPLQYLDMYTAMGTWKGAYKKAKGRGVSEQQAIEYADRIVRTTQASPLAKDLPAAFTDSETMRTMLAFQTFAVNDWNLLVNHALKTGLFGTNKTQGAMTLLALMSAGTVEQYISKGYDVDKVKEEWEDLVWDKIPIIGNMIRSRKYGSTGVIALDMPAEVVKDGYTLVKNIKDGKGGEQLAKDLVGFVVSVTSAGGVPGSKQAEKTYNQAEEKGWLQFLGIDEKYKEQAAEDKADKISDAIIDKRLDLQKTIKDMEANGDYELRDAMLKSWADKRADQIEPTFKQKSTEWQLAQLDLMTENGDYTLRDVMKKRLDLADTKAESEANTKFEEIKGLSSKNLRKEKMAILYNKSKTQYRIVRDLLDAENIPY